jgi:hypothetical protein
MAGDSDVVHETEPHQVSFDKFWSFTKWGTVSVIIITAFVIFVITR